MVKDEVKYTTVFLLSIGLLLIVMALVSYFFQNDRTADKADDDQATVIMLKAKQQQTIQKKARQTVVSSVREAIKDGKSLTKYMQLANVDSNTSEYKELKKMIDDETKRRTAGGVRKEVGASKKTVRYLDESTPRDRTSDATYIYFVDVSGVLIPRFCVQAALKQHLQMTEVTVAAGSETMSFKVPSYNRESIDAGVAEWYDAPLDQGTYRVVQAIMNAKKAVLTINGVKGKVSRSVTSDEIKAFRRVLDGYSALGGRLDYLEGTKLPDRKKR